MLIPIFQDFNHEPFNTEVSLHLFHPCFTFMILGLYMEDGCTVPLERTSLYESLQVEEVRPTLSAFNGQLTPKRQALLQRKEKFACQCLGSRVWHIQTG